LPENPTAVTVCIVGSEKIQGLFGKGGPYVIACRCAGLLGIELSVRSKPSDNCLIKDSK